MADSSYSELVNAEVKLIFNDFEAKLGAADAAIDALSKDFGVKRSYYRPPSKAFKGQGKLMLQAAENELLEFAFGVMLDSLIEVPVDTTTLYNSAAIQPVVETDRSMSITFGYGYGDEINPKTKRRAAQYALPVHEIYEATHEPPTKSHYLIDPLIENAANLGRGLAASMRGATVKGFRINKGVSLFRKGGGPGIHPTLDPSGKITKRKRS